MLKRKLALVLTALLTLNGYAEEAQTDTITGYEILIHPDTTLAGPFTPSTPYISAQQPHPMLELGLRYRLPYVDLYPNHGTALHCDTEMQPLLSAFLYWKWIKVGYNFALQNINKGFNFSYAINMGHMNVKFNVAHIRNLRLVNEKDYADVANFTEDETRLRALKVTDYDLNVEYACNKNYALLSGYDYSYHRAQLKSQGSGIVAAGYAYNGITKRNFKESAQADAVLATLPLDHADMHMLNLGGGYGYNVAMKGGRWVLGLVCVPYLTAGGSGYEFDGNHKELAYGIRTHGRANLTYNYKYGGISLAGEYNGAYLMNKEFDYRRDVFNIHLNHAFRFGEMGLKSGKVPGHQVIDWSQQMLTGGK